ncbi:THO complex subunit 1 [Balamuthia mandrillaris]
MDEWQSKKASFLAKLAEAQKRGSFSATREEVTQLFGRPSEDDLPADLIEMCLRMHLSSALAACVSGTQTTTTEERQQRAREQAVAFSLDVASFCAKQRMLQQPSGDKGRVDPALLFELFRDVLEGLTTSECQSVWHVFEERADLFAEIIANSRRSVNVLLKPCLQLLRRLSKAVDPVFRGRVLMFLAYIFPLSDPSGLNPKGKSNVANVTVIEEEKATTAAETDGEVVPQGQDGSSPQLVKISPTDPEPPVDWQFYRTFWGLQSFFQDPNSAYLPNKWPQLVSGMTSVLEAFKRNPISPQEAASSAALSTAERANYCAATKCYFTKYLTSSRLLRLQMKDPWFRRHVLVQFLILFQALRVISENNRKTSNSVMTKEQRSEVAVLTRETKNMLIETPPGGKKFTATVYNILKRENNWIYWKQQGCKSFERPPLSPSDAIPVPQPRTNLGKKQGAPAALRRLWGTDDPDNKRLLEALKSAERIKAPSSFREALEPLAEQMDPDAGIEEEYLLTKDKVFVWKTMRVVAKHNTQSFSLLSSGGTLEDVVRSVGMAPPEEEKKKIDGEEEEEQEGEKMEEEEKQKGKEKEDGEDEDEEGEKEKRSNTQTEQPISSLDEGRRKRRRESVPKETATTPVVGQKRKVSASREIEDERDAQEENKAAAKEEDEEETSQRRRNKKGERKREDDLPAADEKEGESRKERSSTTRPATPPLPPLRKSSISSSSSSRRSSQSSSSVSSSGNKRRRTSVTASEEEGEVAE